MKSALPAENAPVPAGDSPPKRPWAEDSRWRRVLCVALVTAIVGPPAFLVALLILVLGYLVVGPDSLNNTVANLAIGLFVILMITGASRMALRDGWHRRPIVFWGWLVVGALAAIFWPIFVPVRLDPQRAQDNAVSHNARQLAVAADQYFQEHQVTSVTYEQLVGPAVM